MTRLQLHSEMRWMSLHSSAWNGEMNNPSPNSPNSVKVMKCFLILGGESISTWTKGTRTHE